MYLTVNYQSQQFASISVTPSIMEGVTLLKKVGLDLNGLRIAMHIKFLKNMNINN